MKEHETLQITREIICNKYKYKYIYIHIMQLYKFQHLSGYILLLAFKNSEFSESKFMTNLEILS